MNKIAKKRLVKLKHNTIEAYNNAIEAYHNLVNKVEQIAELRATKHR